jgi:hypothetical protein
MTEPYLSPEDVSRLDARKVLSFLNSATTAREIADAVEFPRERDVGVRVGQRILDRRAELGSFTTLQQLADVPQVGPERFTEIVLALSRRSTPEDVAAAFVEEVVQEARLLREQLKALRREVKAVPQIRLRSIYAGPFLGQPTHVIATVVAGDPPEPAVGASVTFTSTWGRLRSFGEMDFVEATAITVPTDVLGNVTLQWVAPTEEPVLHTQSSALVSMLGLLDPLAATPRADDSGLRELVRQYRWPANVEFRAAVDIFFRDFGKDIVDNVNIHDYLAEWHHFDATVLAFVSDGDGNCVEAAAALPLRFRDWPAPWLQTFVATVDSESLIRDELKFQGQQAPDTAGMIESVGGRLATFLDSQEGLAGGYIGREVARRSLEDFVYTEIDDLPLPAKESVFSALHAVSTTVSASGLKALQSLNDTRTGVRREFVTHVAQAQDAINVDFQTQISEVQQQLGTKIGAEDLQTLEAQLSQSFDIKLQEAIAAKVDIQMFESAIADKVDVSSFRSEFDTLNAKVSRMERGESPPEPR